MTNFRTILVAMVLLAPTILPAASLDLLVRGEGANADNVGPGGADREAAFSRSTGTGQHLFYEIDGSFDGSGAWGSASASSVASADLTTGTLSFEVDATRSGTDDSLPLVKTDTRSLASEIFTVSGTGSLTALMNYSASWSTNDAFSFTASLGFWDGDFKIGGGTNSFTATEATHDNVDSVDGVIRQSALFENAVDVVVRVEWQIDGTISTDQGNGFNNVIDATDGGLFAFLVSDGLTFTHRTDEFLNNPTFQPSPVPLPAGGMLLLTGLVVLFWWRRRA